MSAIRNVSESEGKGAQELFLAIYPLTCRAAEVRSAAAARAGSIMPVDRSDMQQEALTGVWEAISIYMPERASLRTFVECIVRNQSVSFVRDQRRWVHYATERTLEKSFDARQSTELRLDVRIGLSLLSPGNATWQPG